MYRLALKDPCKSALQKALQPPTCRQYGRGKNLPPNAQEAGFGKVFLIMSPLVAVGGVVTYSKHDPKFRKAVEEKVPGAEYFLKVALQEENPFEGINKRIDNVKQSFEEVTTTVTDFFSFLNFSKKDPEKGEGDTELPFQKGALVTKDLIHKPQITDKAQTPQQEKRANPFDSNVAKDLPITQADIDALPKEVVELERIAEVAAEVAVKEYHKAIAVLKHFNEDVRNVVDKAVTNIDTSMWNTLKNKTGARDTSVQTAERAAREAVNKIEKCQIALSRAANDKNIQEVDQIRNKIKKLLEHINQVKDELYKNKDVAQISEKYWRSVETARLYFIDEIESIFPGLSLSERKLDLSKEDLDLFIMHAYSHVLAYQKELQRLQTDGELRLKRAIEAYRGEDNTEAAKAQVEYLLETEKRKLAIDNQKKIFQIRAESEKQLRNHLKQQAEAHVEHLNDAIAMKETELRRSFHRELDDKLATEKANYKLQLATMLGKMRGMDAALQARAESERSAHQAQALWAACQALWATVRTGEPGTHWSCKLRPLKSEIKAISKVAQGDELVAVVLKNLPPEAEERGVYPEDALRERFLNVERIARRVALVPESGATLPQYILSYVQSLFIMTPRDPITQEELRDEEFDYSKLDTYDILNRAKYYVDRGNLLQALKYMNLLQGAARKISSDWQKETRLLLETQQAANTLMAHAAASGLLYL